MTYNSDSSISSERGFALIYMCVVLAVLLLFTGLAVDTGRAYVVKAQLSKAVDGAALGRRAQPEQRQPEERGDQRSSGPTSRPATWAPRRRPTRRATPNFFSSTVDAATGVNTVTVNATAVLPTTFMKLANFNQVTVVEHGRGDAAHGRPVAGPRRVELDRIAVGRGARRRPRVRQRVRQEQRSRRAPHLRQRRVGPRRRCRRRAASTRRRSTATCPTTLPGGSTNMVEGLYRGWDELRSVPAGQQSGLRVIVLFTDGASNSVPGNYDAAPGQGRALRTYDFPKYLPDPDGQTWDNPDDRRDCTRPAARAARRAPASTVQRDRRATGTTRAWSRRTSTTLNCPSIATYLPLTSYHANHRSSGIPTSFPLHVELADGQRHGAVHAPVRCAT